MINIFTFKYNDVYVIKINEYNKKNTMHMPRSVLTTSL